jgi:hypothetical protein
MIGGRMIGLKATKNTTIEATSDKKTIPMKIDPDSLKDSDKKETLISPISSSLISVNNFKETADGVTKNIDWS